MVRCKDNSIYSGYTVDLQKRIETHNMGKGAKYTRARLPVKLEYFEEFDDKKMALKREREFKKYTHSQKEKIIKENNWGKKGTDYFFPHFFVSKKLLTKNGKRYTI